MGDVADDMWNEAARWHDESVICPYHGVRYIPDYPCPVCEDGEEFHEWKPRGKFRGKLFTEMQRGV